MDPKQPFQRLTSAERVGTDLELAQPDEYRTMVEIAFRYLRDSIVRGELRPGDKVPQREIADRLGISRMPLREALRKLEERHFVRIVAHRGAYVAPLSVEDIKEIYVVRIALESVSAGLAAENMSDDRLAELHAILEVSARAIADRDTARLSDANRRFHQVGHEASHNVRLTRLIADLSDHAQRYRLLHTTLGERPQTALREHENLLAAWERRDANAASYWVRINLVNSEEALLGAIQASRTGVPSKADGVVKDVS